MSRPANSEDFAQAFGDALLEFLRARDISQSDVARKIGLEEKKGRSRINTYCRNGHRATPDANILYLLCTRLGFNFEYKGYKLSAATLNGNGSRPAVKSPEQLSITFGGQFNLTDQKKTVEISVKRPPGRIEVALLLEG
jgi:transcriptional regulator with XRE-family HTH domain